LFRLDQHRQPQQHQHQRQPIPREHGARTARVVRRVMPRDDPPLRCGRAAGGVGVDCQMNCALIRV
jgi:hypothetical protein